MKKIICLLLSFICVCLLCSCGENAPETVKIYATVNGEEITQEEIDYFSKRMKADVLSDYVQKYDVSDFADFWDKEFEGKTPNQELEERAFDEAVRSKIVLVLMRENGIYENITFAGLKQKAENFNNTNKNSNEPLIGIKTIDLEQFYTYYISNGEMELKNILGEGDLKPTDDEFSQRRSVTDEDMSDEMVKSVIVGEKYDAYIAELIEKAEIVK